jgi:FAD-dependent urate hydroxylase
MLGLMNEHTAIIVGAGIAGPALALWLQRIGIRAVVAEARDSAALAEGAFLGVAPNGMNALEDLGLAEQVLAAGHACRAFQFMNSRGRHIGFIDRSRDRASFRFPLTMVRRADLHALLAAEATRRGVEIRYGARLSSLTQTEHEVSATFEDESVLTGSILLGCDGLRSKTRALIAPDAPAPVFSGLLDFGGFARVDGLPFEPGVNTMVRAFFGAFTTPDGETWWFHNGPPDVPMLELHRDDPPWISELIRATPKVLGPWPLHELPAIPSWSRGRVALLGDAAHAMSPSAGQGASLALEDAMVLAQCLRDDSSAPRAFVTFERLRRRRVDAIWKSAQRHSNNKAPSKVQAWFRDRLLSLFVKLGEKEQQRAYSFRIDWDARTT